MIDWKKISKADYALIDKIVDRALQLEYIELGEKQSLEMDIAAAHLHKPLRLEELLRAPRADFGHDVHGIRAYIDRETGAMTEHFVPRAARSS
jgi:hypothetical protein